MESVDWVSFYALALPLLPPMENLVPRTTFHSSKFHNQGWGRGYGYILGPSPVPPIYLAGSFGPVLLPGWLDYIRSTAVPQIVEGSPDLPARRSRSPLPRMSQVTLAEAPAKFI